MSERPLTLRASLLEQLQIHRAQLQRSQPPVIDARDVALVESELGLSLPDELLATFAMLGLDLRQILVLTTDLEEDGLPPRLFPCLEDPAGFVWCLRPGQKELVSWPRHEASALSLTGIVRRWRRAHAGARSGSEPKPDDALPMLREVRVAPRFVQHPRFGVGAVVQENFDGHHSMLVDFENVGRKRLLAAFLEPIERVA